MMKSARKVAVANMAWLSGEEYVSSIVEKKGSAVSF